MCYKKHIFKKLQGRWRAVALSTSGLFFSLRKEIPSMSHRKGHGGQGAIFSWKSISGLLYQLEERGSWKGESTISRLHGLL